MVENRSRTAGRRNQPAIVLLFTGKFEAEHKYYWRWVDNEKKAVRQVRAGRIAPSSISSIYDPVSGISVTNASTKYRRSFGEYTIADHTEPGWTVELYVNNVIVDYQTADATGFYSFNVPLVYGSSEVMLKFYGPYGEERIQRQYINIPFNFLPKGEWEYNVSYGCVLDKERSRFGKAEAKYGINRHVTVGGGMEYLSSIADGKKSLFSTLRLPPRTCSSAPNMRKRCGQTCWQVTGFARASRSN